MSVFDSIQRPTLVIDRRRVQENIRRMAARAAGQGVRFRPHFKTHQAAAIGEWFRAENVEAITVSSVEMAEYFAGHGWQDILIAFSANLREREAIRSLADRVHLGLLFESIESIQGIAARLDAKVDAWLKIDTGAGRTGIMWDRPDAVLALIESVQAQPALRLRGLLTHAGQTYQVPGPAEACCGYKESVQRLVALREVIHAENPVPLELSVGDTPGCTSCEELGPVDEIRPGNFVFFDGMQLRAGVCTADQVAAVVACPVVAKHPDRLEVVVYGGAVHLSKDTLLEGEERVFGYVAFPHDAGWSDPIPGGAVVRMSQEHGIVRLPQDAFDRVRIGDLLCVIPAHICLTVSALGRYLTLDGEPIETLVTA